MIKRVKEKFIIQYRIHEDYGWAEVETLDSRMEAVKRFDELMNKETIAKCYRLIVRTEKVIKKGRINE